MVDDQKGNAFDFRGQGESKDGLAVAVRSCPVIDPPFLSDFVLRIDDL
jgi:hypothetical protein